MWQSSTGQVPSSDSRMMSTWNEGSESTNSAVLTSSGRKPNRKDFVVIKGLGTGGYAKVVLVYHKDDPNSRYAMKCISKASVEHSLEKNLARNIKRERSILGSLDNPFVTNLYYAFQSDEHLYLVMEYIKGGNLMEHLIQCQESNKSLSEGQIRLYIAEMILGLEYLHSKGIIYRDLKLENILIRDDGHLCLSDFGLAKEIDTSSEDSRTYTLTGAPGYIAPEIINEDSRTNHGYGQSCDLWSLGIVVYMMACSYPPFFDNNDSMLELFDKILNSPVVFDDRDCKVSDELQSLIFGLLKKDPAQRLTIERVKNHPFFEDLDWDKVTRREYPPENIPQEPRLSRPISLDSIICDSGEETNSTKRYSGFSFDGVTSTAG